MDAPGDSARTDRRRFLMLMGLACASTAVAHPAAALAAPPPAPPAPASAAEPQPPSAEARALAEVVRLRHGEHLSTAQIGVIAQDLDVRLEGGRELRKLRLENGDEPDATFTA